MKARNLQQVNQAIQNRRPFVFLVKGKGYYYIASNHEETSLRIASLYQSSIYVYSITNLSVEQWIDAVDHLFNNLNNYD